MKRLGIEEELELEKALEKALGLEGTFFYLDEIKVIEGGIIIPVDLYSTSKGKYISVKVYIEGDFKITD